MPQDHSHILLVEDDTSSAHIIRISMERAGHRVLHAEDGQAALELCAESTPSLIVLDLMMPRVNGFQFLRRFREAGNEDIPVIILSAKVEEVDRFWAKKLGAAHYFTKPVVVAELLAAMEELLSLPSKN